MGHAANKLYINKKKNIYIYIYQLYERGRKKSQEKVKLEGDNRSKFAVAPKEGECRVTIS